MNKQCDTGFECSTCPINSNRTSFKVSVEDMNKYGLCFGMTEDEQEQMLMNNLSKGCIHG